jgi:hypothetical protein
MRRTLKTGKKSVPFEILSDDMNNRWTNRELSRKMGQGTKDEPRKEPWKEKVALCLAA